MLDHHVGRLHVQRQEGVDAFADRHRPFRADPWRLAFTPAGCPVYSASKRGGEYLVLSVAPATLARLAPGLERGWLPQFTNVSDSWFTPLAMALRRIACSSEVIDGLHTEALAAAAVDRLAAKIDGSATVTGIAAGITPRRMKLILDTSTLIWIRMCAWRTSPGASVSPTPISPARSELRRAISARSVGRKANRSRPPADEQARSPSDGYEPCGIAAESGFSSHAHMATAFRRVLGTTPSHWAKVAAQYSNE